MKIACIGNMNNMVFPTCLYLLDANFKVTLFLLKEYECFMPKPSMIPNKLEVMELGWHEENWTKIKAKKIVDIFKTYDFFIGTDYSAAFLAKARIKLDVYMPAGTDIYLWPFYRLPKNKIPNLWTINRVSCSQYQFRGIKHSRFLSLDACNEEVEKKIDLINSNFERIPILPFFHTSEIANNTNEPSIQNETVALKIIQQGRQSWKYESSNLHDKGNDILIKGFALAVKNKKLNLEMSLFIKGEHVNESKKLIKDLGIESYVKWLESRHKSELLDLIPKHDILVGNLKGLWYSYGSVYESLASKTAFMGYRKDEYYSKLYEDMYPMINVSSPEQVAEQLEYYYYNRTELNNMAENGYNWLISSAINPVIIKLIEIIKNHKGRERLPWSARLFIMNFYFSLLKILWGGCFVYQRFTKSIKSLLRLN